MAVDPQQSLGDLQRYLDQGWAPRHSSDSPQMDTEMRTEIANRDDLLEWLGDEAYAGRLDFTQQDIYDFFIKRDEEQALQQAEDRWRDLYGQTRAGAQQKTGQLGARLGFQDTSLGAQLARSVDERGGGLSASKGLEDAKRAAIDIFERPGRMARVDEIQQQYESGAQARGAHAAKGGAVAGSAIGTGISAALLAASTGPQAVITAPLAALIGGITAAASVAGGSAAGAAHEKSILGGMRKGVKRFKKGGIKGGDFSATAGAPLSTGASFSPTGSNQRNLMSLYAPSAVEEEADSSFLFG